MSVLKVSNLRKLYGKAVGADDVSLSVDEGEIVGFVGPNGSGKSTTIRCIVGVLTASSGEIEVFNKKLTDENISEINKSIGYVSSEISLYQRMTAIEQLKMIAEIKGVDIAQINELAKELDLNLSKKISEMSLGNKKKVAIIAAFIGNPKLLILDEPTSGFDPLVQQKFFKLLQKQVKKGTSVLLSTHILSDIQKVADRVVVIKDGKTVAENLDPQTETQKIKIVEIELEPNAQLPEIEGAKAIKKKGNTFTFKFNGETKVLLKQLAKISIVNVNISEVDIEDKIMHFYEQGKEDDK